MADGRRWRTECDTALTGNGGCRTWATARVIETYTDASGRKAFRWATREVFNNMVRFSAAAPAPKPTPTPTPTGFALTKISDANLRACVAETLGVAAGSTVTTGQLASIETSPPWPATGLWEQLRTGSFSNLAAQVGWPASVWPR